MIGANIVPIAASIMNKEIKFNVGVLLITLLLVIIYSVLYWFLLKGK